jgi:RNA polymerase sigma-70 factor (ECF subfamily)
VTWAADAELAGILASLANSKQDEDAWSYLYNRMWPYVYGLVFRRNGGEKARTEDTCQDVFVRLLRYADFHRLMNPAAFRAYLAAIAEHEVARRAAEKHRDLDQLDKFGVEIDIEDPRQHAAERLEVHDLLENVIQSLDPKEQALMHLMLAGTSNSEMARRLELPYGTVGVRIHRLRQKLAAHPLLGFLAPKER